MAEERQQQRASQPNEQNQQSQAIQRRGGQQTGMARRGRSMGLGFPMDPFDMLRMSPFALMRRLTEDMDSLFSQFGMERGGHGTTTASRGLFSPPVEMLERGGNFIVRAELPGMTKDDVQVEITEDTLTIEGERRAEHEEQQEGVFRSERRYGMFHRQIMLPEGVNADQATATFKDGVLEITMPAPQRQTRGRQIQIQGDTSSNAPSQGTHSAQSQGTHSAQSHGAHSARSHGAQGTESQASSGTGSQASQQGNQEHAQTTSTTRNS